MITHSWLCDKYLDQPGFNGVWQDKNGFVLSYNEACPLRIRAWLRVRRFAGRWPVKYLKGGAFVANRETEPLRLTDRLEAGGSAGHVNITAGTNGGYLKIGENVYSGSNNHVYADSNDAAIGDNILRPGPFDGGTVPGNVMGQLAGFVPINFSGGSNFVDFAICGPLAADKYKREILEVERYATAWRDIGLNDEGSQSGRTTGRTEGEVTGTNATTNVSYGDGKTARFVEQFVVEGKLQEEQPCDLGFFLCLLCSIFGSFFDFCPNFGGGREQFSAGGDSGSWVLIEDRGQTKFVGLLFAGSDTQTIMNHPRHVFGAFEGMELL